MPDPADAVVRTDLHLIERVLSQLMPREADILRRRFGMDGRASLTLEEIGAQYRVTGEGIGQIEARELRHSVRCTRCAPSSTHAPAARPGSPRRRYGSATRRR